MDEALQRKIALVTVNPKPERHTGLAPQGMELLLTLPLASNFNKRSKMLLSPKRQNINQKSVNSVLAAMPPEKISHNPTLRVGLRSELSAWGADRASRRQA
ncbi:hypothetical protein [Mixta intestinalis]|uniref:Uncharacterized protein n=1 Tax=Mixta intestinalis TaxID=1615494 RepID=A0A6P1Q1M5_9GAMM|nr:hypothetical protein [Mixta intestinalis]QHM71918.1 hypothetical protein C7M51_02211 [Mixta intestinalis]